MFGIRPSGIAQARTHQGIGFRHLADICGATRGVGADTTPCREHLRFENRNLKMMICFFFLLSSRQFLCLNPQSSIAYNDKNKIKRYDKKNFVEELKWRGMLAQIMPGTEELLQKEMVTAYLGNRPNSRLVAHRSPVWHHDVASSAALRSQNRSSLSVVPRV
jgi:hypothetical protein